MPTTLQAATEGTWQVQDVAGSTASVTFDVSDSSVLALYPIPDRV